MFYFLFKNIYLSLKMKIERGNRIRIKNETLPSGVLRREYTYATDRNQFCLFNLYRMDQKNTKSFPLIIDIHGGAWICGDKDTNGNFNYHLALNGYNVSSLSYRTVDHCTLKEQIQDIFDYFHFLKNHEEQLEITFDQIILTGDSAGGQLALLTYCINQNSKLQKLFSVTPIDMEVKCLILNHSVCYIDEAANLPQRPTLSRFVSIPGLQRILYGKNYAGQELYLNTVNPTKFLFKETLLPPVLLITSKGDTAYCYQTLKLYDYLTGLGKSCELYFEQSPSAKHVFNIVAPDSPEGKKCNDFLLQYINCCQSAFSQSEESGQPLLQHV